MRMQPRSSRPCAKHRPTHWTSSAPPDPCCGPQGLNQLLILTTWPFLDYSKSAGRCRNFWRAFKLLKQAAIERRPDAVILVDWPDFNLKLARSLHRRGLKVIYYISPQLWAWRSYRSRTIRRDVDLLLSILPFEKEWYEDRGVEQVEFVGHPLVGQVSVRYDRDEFCRQAKL